LELRRRSVWESELEEMIDLEKMIDLRIVLLILQANLTLANLDEDAPGQPLPRVDHLLEFEYPIIFSGSN
jgi:hypothetical protein